MLPRRTARGVAFASALALAAFGCKARRGDVGAALAGAGSGVENPDFSVIYSFDPAKLQAGDAILSTSAKSRVEDANGRCVVFSVEDVISQTTDGYGFNYVDCRGGGVLNDRGFDFLLTPAGVARSMRPTGVPAPRRTNLQEDHLVSHRYELLSIYLADVRVASPGKTGDQRDHLVTYNQAVMLHPRQELCAADEVAMTAAPGHMATLDDKYLKRLHDNHAIYRMIDERSHATLCVKVALLGAFSAIGDVVADAESLRLLHGWTPAQVASFYQRIGRKPDVATVRELRTKIEPAGEDLLVTYLGPLIGTCKGACTVQGFKMRMRRDGTVLDFPIDPLKPGQKRVLRNLYYYNDQDGELPFDNPADKLVPGDFERLTRIANDRARLQEIYTLLSDQGDTGGPFTSRMSQVYLEGTRYDALPGESPSARRPLERDPMMRRAGSAVATLIVILAQVRERLAQDYPNDRPAEPWPTYHAARPE
jgi:hypothetical protein